MKNVIVFTIINYILAETYTPYTNDINSIFGTGDTDNDLIYRKQCKEICQTCCTGELHNITCAKVEYCTVLQKELDIYLYTIILSVYFGMLILTMVIMFLVFYLLSRKVYNKATSLKNGAVAAILTLMAGLVVPVIVLKMVAVWKDKSMTSLLGGDFKKLSSTIISTRIKLTERQKKYVIEESDNESSQEKHEIAATKRVLNGD
jgi:hypothetical protein